MTATRLRPTAQSDLVERTRWYADTGGRDLGARFFDAAIATLDAIGRMPGVGSSQFAEQCGVPGLRARPVDGFPCAWFYRVDEDGVDVIRLVADGQDIPRVLADPG